MCFKTYLNHPINKKWSRKKNNLRRSQFSRKRGGGPARYDHDHRFNGFFTPSLSQWDRCQFDSQVELLPLRTLCRGGGSSPGPSEQKSTPAAVYPLSHCDGYQFDSQVENPFFDMYSIHQIWDSNLQPVCQRLEFHTHTHLHWLTTM